MDILEIMNIPYYKEGNTIHIKKKKIVENLQSQQKNIIREFRNLLLMFLIIKISIALL